MGELLLCSQELASIPYYIESISLNVYSLEELCYFLQHNIDLVEPSFMEEELVNWIHTELKLSSLSKKLHKLMSEGGGLSEFVTALAAACNYCTKEEIAKMQEALAAFENKSETECRKIRADRFLEKRRYSSSIIEYQKLLEFPEVTGLLEGNIYHNLGTAYAGLFLFEEAAACFGKAYEKNQNPVSAKQQQAAMRLAEGKLPQAELPENTRFQMPQTVLEEWKEAYRKSCR